MLFRDELDFSTSVLHVTVSLFSFAIVEECDNVSESRLTQPVSQSVSQSERPEKNLFKYSATDLKRDDNDERLFNRELNQSRFTRFEPEIKPSTVKEILMKRLSLKQRSKTDFFDARILPKIELRNERPKPYSQLDMKSHSR